LETLDRLVLEGNAAAGIFCSPLLQACAGSIIALDLAICGDDATKAVKMLRALTLPTTKKVQAPKHPPKVQEVVDQLIEMGFSAAAIEAGLKAKGEVETLNNEKGTRTLRPGPSQRRRQSLRRTCRMSGAQRGTRRQRQRFGV